MHRGSRKGVAQRGNKVSFGSYGLQSLERAWITGTHQHMLDPDDPFPRGYRLSDTWPMPGRD